jgi:peptidylprolyl isomerase
VPSIRVVPVRLREFIVSSRVIFPTIAAIVISMTTTLCASRICAAAENGSEPGDLTKAAATGDVVLVNYTGRTTDDVVFEQTPAGEPRGIRLGSNQVLPTLEKALVGIRAGESRTIRIGSEDAFGPYRDEPGMKTRLQREALSHHLEPYVGMRLNAAVFVDENAGESSHVPVTVVEVTDEYLVIDANHPLAGKDLIFEVKAVEIIDGR